MYDVCIVLYCICIVLYLYLYYIVMYMLWILVVKTMVPRAPSNPLRQEAVGHEYSLSVGVW